MASDDAAWPGTATIRNTSSESRTLRPKKCDSGGLYVAPECRLQPGTVSIRYGLSDGTAGQVVSDCPPVGRNVDKTSNMVAGKPLHGGWRFRSVQGPAAELAALFRSRRSLPLRQVPRSNNPVLENDRCLLLWNDRYTASSMAIHIAGGFAGYCSAAR